MTTPENMRLAREYRERAERYRAEAARYWFRRDKIEQLTTGAWVLDRLADQLDGGAVDDADADPDAIFRQD